MPTASPLSHAGAGRLEGRRIGLRSGSGEDCVLEVAPDALRAGRRALGACEIEILRSDQGDAATLGLRLRNASSAPLRLDSVLLGFCWREHGQHDLRFLRNGWQSWSATGMRTLDEAGEPGFPSGAWLRGMHHARGALPADRAGWHESHIVGVAGGSGGGPVCLAGVLEAGIAFGLVYLKREGTALLVEVELVVEATLEPGERLELEAVRVALGLDANRLLERFANLWGARNQARSDAPFQAGWCSWYHFFHEISQDDLLRNLDALAADRDGIPVEVVQLDDGYQSEVGDWLDTNEKFPMGLAAIASRIREAGFRAGLWTAPFCAVPESRLAAEHPQWLLRAGDGFFQGLVHPQWTPAARVHALDTSRGDVLAHLESLFAALVEMGFDYLKLDFLYVVAMRADAADPHRTRAARLRSGLEAVRRGAGEAAFLLGCGCPLGPAVGLVDAMRIGPDVAPWWALPESLAIPGIEATQPALKSAIESVVHRAWMHRRLWQNDPDCLMVRSGDTELTRNEVGVQAAAIGASGGLVVVSDDVPGLSAGERRELRDCLALAREVDAAAPQGAARSALLAEAAEAGEVRAIEARVGLDRVEAMLNVGERSVRLAGGEERAAATLLPHSARLSRRRTAHTLAVFCDFDGTFSVQDVGSTLAKIHLADRRPALWARFERGDFSAWEYNLELLEGFALPERELDRFLETIDLDPGARALLDWCEKRRVPFEILSDGFDHNLERLQRLHDLRFDYASNRLRYEEGVWRIAPGAPNPDCHCGTGTCKRGRIARYRARHPEAVCVHIGNGRVSDLCGALEADIAFAKDTLAPALRERGCAYEPFETLHEVVEALERRFGSAYPGPTYSPATSS